MDDGCCGWEAKLKQWWHHRISTMLVHGQLVVGLNQWTAASLLPCFVFPLVLVSFYTQKNPSEPKCITSRSATQRQKLPLSFPTCNFRHNVFALSSALSASPPPVSFSFSLILSPSITHPCSLKRATTWNQHRLQTQNQFNVSAWCNTCLSVQLLLPISQLIHSTISTHGNA